MGIISRISESRLFRQRLVQCRPRLYRMAFAWCHNPHIADDLVQDALAKALQRHSQLQNPNAVEAWMMEANFISASANIYDLDPVASDIPIIRQRQDDVTLNTVMSNSFGFGGTNATLVFRRFTV